MLKIALPKYEAKRTYSVSECTSQDVQKKTCRYYQDIRKVAHYLNEECQKKSGRPHALRPQFPTENQIRYQIASHHDVI